MLVNIRDITDNPRVIPVLEAVQKAILEDSSYFNLIAAEPELRALTQEVRQLQNLMLQAVQQQVQQLRQEISGLVTLLEQWTEEKDLKDVITFDQNHQQNLLAKLAMAQTYIEWDRLLKWSLRYKENLVTKYLGYFEGQAEASKAGKEELESQMGSYVYALKQAEFLAGELQALKNEVGSHVQRAEIALAAALGLLLGACLLGYRQGGIGGGLFGFLAGYWLFINLFHGFAYVQGEPVQQLYERLTQYVDGKKLTRVFRPAKTPGALIFDASKGSALTTFLEKELRAALQKCQSLDRKIQESQGHIRFIEQRYLWHLEQGNAIKARAGQ